MVSTETLTMGGAGVDVWVLVGDGCSVGTAVAVSVGVYAGVALVVACIPPAAMKVAIADVARFGLSELGNEHEAERTMSESAVTKRLRFTEFRLEAFIGAG